MASRQVGRLPWAYLLLLLLGGCWGGIYLGTSGILDEDDPTGPHPTPFSMIGPSDQSTVLSLTPSFSWADADLETSYQVQVADNPDFNPLLHTSPLLESNSLTYTLPPGLTSAGIPYYWRVSASNGFGPTPSDPPYLTFTPTLGLWSKTFGGRVGQGRFARETADGGTIMIATHDVPNLAGAGGDLWVIRLNNDVSTRWTRSIGGGGYEYAKTCFETSDGGFIVCGRSRSFGPGPQAWWIIKLNENGNIEWQNSYGSSTWDHVHQVIPTTDGGFLAAGSSSHTDAAGDGVAIKLNGDGTIVWQTFLGGPGGGLLDAFRSVVETSDGGFLFGGITASFGAGGEDGWVVKLDSAGSLLWSRAFGGSGNDQFINAKTTADGGVIAAGRTNTAGWSSGGNDLWAVKLKMDLTIDWEFSVGTTDADVAREIQETSDGNFIMVGDWGDPGSSWPSEWIIKTDPSGTILFQRFYSQPGGWIDYGHSIQETSDGRYLFCGESQTATGSVGTEAAWVFKMDPDGTLFFPMGNNTTETPVTTSAVMDSTTPTTKAGSFTVTPTTVSPEPFRIDYHAYP